MASTIQGKDADIMIIGGIPDKLKDDKQIDLLVQATESWVKTPMRQTRSPACAGRERSRGRNPSHADLFRCDGGG
ncbi:cellulose synthase regulator protein [Escherichia coli]|uniref:Cellulose synthase regulator protein n=1 Tax=Escherichia coli TaxID=562 RepID=A0A376MM10_ECOLX|nr:cellulose synthase regulator protein [Escherichia coli]